MNNLYKNNVKSSIAHANVNHSKSVRGSNFATKAMETQSIQKNTLGSKLSNTLSNTFVGSARNERMFPFDASMSSIHLPTSFSSTILVLTNKSNVSQRIVVLPFLTPHFKVTRLDQHHQNGLIAPGMTIKLKIELNAITQGEKYSDSLRLRAASTMDSSSVSETEIDILGGDWSMPPQLTVINENTFLNPSQHVEESNIAENAVDRSISTPKTIHKKNDIKRNSQLLTKSLRTTMKSTSKSNKNPSQDKLPDFLTNINPNDSIRSIVNPMTYNAFDFQNLPRVFNFLPTLVGGRSEQRFVVKNIGEQGATFHWTTNPNDKNLIWQGDQIFQFVSFERSEIYHNLYAKEDKISRNKLASEYFSNTISDMDSEDMNNRSYFDCGKFYLESNETGIAVLSFLPPRTDTLIQQIYLVNDVTHDIFEFTLVGEGVWPEIIRDPEAENAPISNTIFFPSVYSTGTAERTIQYSNLSSVPIHFHWRIFTLHKDSNGNKHILCQNLNELLESDSPVSIQPCTGELSPNSQQVFTIQFSGPTNLPGPTTFDSFIALYIDEIPGPIPENFDSIEDYPFKRHLQTDTKQYFFKKLSSQISSTDPHNCFQTPESLFEELLSTVTENEVEPTSHCSVCISFVKIHASCEPLPIRFSNHHFLFGLPLTIGSVTEKTIEIINDTPISTSFSFGDTIDENAFSVRFHPNEGSLPAYSRQMITFSFLPRTVGELATAFQCHMADNVCEPIVFRIRAIVKGPTLYIDSPMIDFGVAEVGEPLSRTIRLTNSSNGKLNFLFGTNNQSSENSVEKSIESNDEQSLSLESDPEPAISFEPSSYQLQPFESILVSVNLQGAHPCSLNEIIPIYVEFGDTSYVTLRADLQRPKVILGESGVVDFGVTYINTESHEQIVTMRNITSVPTNFYWYCDELNQDEDFQVTVTPNTAIIAPNGNFDVRIRTLSRTLGEFEKILPCFFQENQSLFSGVILKSKVENLSIQIATNDGISTTPWRTITDDNYSLDNFVIDFGEIVIGDKPKSLTLKLKKLVPIFAFFKIHFENYQAPVIHSRRQANVSFHGEAVSRHSSSTSRSSNLLRNAGRSSAIRTTGKLVQQKSIVRKQAAPFQSKDAISRLQTLRKEESDKEFFEEALSNEYGCSFDASLLNGPIDGETNIQLTCYSNLAGEYHDFMVVEIEPLPPLRIPVKARSIGCPVRLLPKTLGLRPMKDLESQLNPILIWPNVPPFASESNQSITRTIQVQNIFGVEVDLKWHFVPGGAPIKTKILENESGMIKLECEENDIDISMDPTLSASIPFSCSPMTAVLKPGEVKQLQLKYTPKSMNTNDLNIWGECYLKSICTLPTQRKYPANVEDKYRTNSETSSLLQPLRLLMTGEYIQPEVDVHCTSIKYKCSIYEVQRLVELQRTSQDQSLPQKEIKISNPTSAPSSFTLSFSDKNDIQKKSLFKILHSSGGVHPLSRNTVELNNKPHTTRKLTLAPVHDPLKETKKLTKNKVLGLQQKFATGNLHNRITHVNNTSKLSYQLNPGEEMNVVAYIRLDQLSSIHHEYENQGASFKSRESLPGKFKIEFSNGHIQTIPTEIVVHYPTISTNMSSLNFGAVGRNPVTRSFRIINYSTVSPARWKIIEPRQDAPVFYITGAEETQTSSRTPMLGGVISPHDSAEVLVTFRPRASKQYDMNILIHVEGGKHIAFIISGLGQLDEQEIGDEDTFSSVELSRNVFKQAQISAI